jgi:Domain of unknown function (DUF6798)
VIPARDGLNPRPTPSPERVQTRPRIAELGTPTLRDLGLLLLISVVAVQVHGYHPGIEDAEIYLPAVKKALNPALYPHNAQFFESHARMTFYPRLIAWSIRASHLPVDWAMLLWHLASIFLLLLACWHLGRLVFRTPLARWGGVALVAALLTLPVAGSALYLMDEYMNPRSLSTPAMLFMIAHSLERRFVRVALWAAFIALIHPLMFVFGASYILVLLWAEHRQLAAQPDRQATLVAAMMMFPFGLFPPVSDAYREAFHGKPYFFLLQWHWYEWLGIFAPLLLLGWFRSIARKQELRRLQRMCSALVLYGLIFLAIGLLITVPARFLNLVELQPMRAFHLLYVLLALFAGGLLAEFVLQRHVWRWMALFLPLCGVMAYTQWQLFPATPHVEWPGAGPRNDWIAAFQWIKQNTPADAYFALDPDYMALRGEDQHGFRAIAERSRLADNVKDRGVVIMFPAMAPAWLEQVRAQQPWQSFQPSDFRRLDRSYGVDWVVVENPAAPGLACPYHNQAVAVCRITG